MSLHVHGTRRAACVFALLVATAAGAQSLQGLAADEIERRNAAVGFALPKAMALSVVRQECGTLAPDTDTVAQAWWTRNREDLDAATAWAGRYLSALQASEPARHRSESAELLKATSGAMLATVRTFFSRALPDAATCGRVLSLYQAGALDIATRDPRPEFQRFQEFAQTLARVRSEPGYRPPEERFRTFESAVPAGRFGLLASLDALERARESRDGAAATRVLTSMADRGDGRAAQTLGRMYLGGELLAADPSLAYRWFHRAFVLGDPSGLNALGVAWRDGVGVGVDRTLALASFHLAASLQRDPAERERARANAERLAAGMSAAERAAAGCLKLGAALDALAAPLAGTPGVHRPQVQQADRRVGEVAPALASACS